MDEEKVTLMLDKIVWEKFRRYCAANAFKISAKIQLLLDEEMERGPKTKSLLDMFKEIIEKESKKDAVETKQTDLDGNITNVQKMPSNIEIEKNVVRYDNPKMINEGSKVPTIEQLMLKRKSF